MPFTRYVIRNEYSLADPEVYRCVEKDDPEALLEGIAMAGLIGVLRQLGDLSEFAAELFRELHEEVMATSARGHGLMIRVQQLELELPSIEKSFLSRTNHLEFAYGTGSDWHSSERIEQNLVTRGDLPRFVMESYEECRAPPRLFLLDKFDIAGAGACLKRYSDPSFFKTDLGFSGALKVDEVQMAKRARRVKKKALKQRNGDTLEALLDSSTDDVSLVPDVKSTKPEKIPFHIVKLKMRQLSGYACPNKKLGGTYMEQILEATVENNDKILANGNVQVPSSKRLKGTLALPSNELACDLRQSAPEKSVETIDHGKQQVITVNDGVQEDMVVDNESKTLMITNGEGSNDFAGELETYLDALATIESEIETDCECQIKHENELFTLNHQDVDSDTNGDHLRQPSESCSSLVEKSPASYDLNCSSVEGEQEISYVDSLHGLTDRKPPQVAKVLPIDDSLETVNAPSDSQDSLELMGAILGHLCNKPSTSSAENAHISLTDDVLVRPSASNGLPIVEEMHVITLAESGENSVEAPISNTIVDAPFESAASSMHVITLAESGESSIEAPISNTIVDASFESAASCLVYEDAACGSAEHAAATNLSSRNEKSGPGEGQIMVPVMTSESNELCKSVESLNSDVAGVLLVEGASSCKMSGDEASASLMVRAVSNFACLQEEPIKDGAQELASLTLPNSEYKPAKSLTGVQSEGAYSCQMPGDVSRSHDKPDLDEIYIPVSVMLPGSNGQDKFVDSLVSDTLDSVQSKGGGGQPPSASTMSNGTLSLPCSHEGSGLEELRIPQGSGSDINADTTSVLELSTTFASNELGFNSFVDQLALPDAPCQSTVAESKVDESMQYPDKVVCCDGFISESGDYFPLVCREEPEQCESGMLAKEELSVDLSKLQHDEMEASRENIASGGNLELIRTITTIEDENCVIIDELAETTAASASKVTQSDQKCADEPTPVLSPHDAVINESTEADITSYEAYNVYDVLAENSETLSRPSVKVIGTTQVVDKNQSSVVSECPDSDEFTLTVEREEFSGKSHIETENLEIPKIVNVVFEESQPKSSSNTIEESSHCVDIESVHVITETVDASCETKDKHIQDEIRLASKYITPDGSLPKEMPSDSVLPNVVGTVEASPQSGTSFSQGDNVSTLDNSLDILSNNENLEICPPCEAIAGPHSHDLAEPSVASECDLSNHFASPEFPHGTVLPNAVAALGVRATVNFDSPPQIHGDGPGKDHHDSAKVSCGDVSFKEETPFQLGVDTCTSPVRALDGSGIEASELDSAGNLLSGHDNLEPPCPSKLGSEQHYLGSESEGNMPLAPLSENRSDANVQSSSTASVNELELGSEQHKLHDEIIAEAPSNLADDSHKECFSCVQPCLRQKAETKDMGVDQPKHHVGKVSATSDNSDIGETLEEFSAYMEPSCQQYLPRREMVLDQPNLHAEQISVVPVTSDSFKFASQEVCLACEEPCNLQKAAVEVNFDQPKHCNEGMTTISEALEIGRETEEARSALGQEQSVSDDRHPSDYAEVSSRNLAHLEQYDISRSLQPSSSTPSEDCTGFVESEEAVSSNYQLPENGRNKLVLQPDLPLAQRSQLQADEVVIMTSADMDAQSSTLELGREENLEQSGHHIYRDLKDQAGLSNNVSVDGIPSISPGQGPNVGNSILPVQDEHFSVPGVLSGARTRSSTTLVFGSAQVTSQTGQVESHKKELVHNGDQSNAGINISTSSLFPPLGIGTETNGMPPLPLPPVEWITGRPRQNFFSLPREASQQPVFCPSFPTSEAGQANGGLPWQRRSLYKRPKDPLIEAVASHDKSTLRKVTERGPAEVKPKADEREVILEQIRAKSFNLKPIAATKPTIEGPKTNIKVAAILEKANAIRQACAGTGSDDDDDEADKWSDA
ncbi:unnamed protein product [Victoria cruziana]